MNLQTPSLTPAQLKVYETIQRNRMAWLTLIVTLVCFVGVLIALIFAAFSFCRWSVNAMGFWNH